MSYIVREQAGDWKWVGGVEVGGDGKMGTRSAM